MALELRRATESDVPALLAQMQPFNEGERIPWQPERIERALRRLLADESLGLVVVAIDAATLHGYAVLTFGFDLEWGGRDAFVTELWVVPEARGRGLGERLLQAADSHARAAGVGALHLVVRHENEGARRLYEREGFKAVPRLLMTKPLD
ncbi:GNAT family N-acetyltransferase [Nannocystaceae bacterium ST9]